MTDLLEFENVKVTTDAIDPLLEQLRNVDVEAMKAKGAAQRADAAERLSTLGPPSQFRLIDCKATHEQTTVVLVDGHAHQDTYTAVSHTWGEEVYAVFDCECACESSACRVPRSSGEGCAGDHQMHKRVVGDILQMCEGLMKAGSELVWHDGVCIAQHNKTEVMESIRHMGWIYAHASDTVIFLDYVGRPMTLLWLDPPYLTRWNRRVWTLQEAVLSRRRRYCIRLLPNLLTNETPHQSIDFFKGPYRSMEEYHEAKLTHFSQDGFIKWSTIMEDVEAKIAHCYEDDSCIAVIEEGEFWSHLVSVFGQVFYLHKYLLIVLSRTMDDLGLQKIDKWLACLYGWALHMRDELFLFPRLPAVLRSCALFRESKHEGDRFNSLLGLAGITDFVAEKDGNFETSSIEFLKRAGQELIGEVLYWVNTNYHWKEEERVHTWFPCFSRSIFRIPNPEPLWTCVVDDDGKSCTIKVKNPCPPILLQIPTASLLEPFRCEVMENGKLKLTGPMIWSVAVQFTFLTRDEDNSGLPSMNNDVEQLDDCNNNILAMDLDATEGINGLQALGQLAYATASSTILGRAIFPLEICPEVEIQQLRPKGSSVYARLVFAHYRTPALIVDHAEDLEAPVSKHGIFKATETLHSLIHERELFPVTFLTQLVIN